MQCNDRFVAVDVPVYQALHQLVALGVEPTVGVGLRHAVGELSVAEIVVGRHGDPGRTAQAGFRGVIPVDVKLPGVDAIVIEYLVQLRAPRGHDDVGCARRWQRLPVDVGIVEEIDAVDDEALLGCCQTL